MLLQLYYTLQPCVLFFIHSFSYWQKTKHNILKTIFLVGECCRICFVTTIYCHLQTRNNKKYNLRASKSKVDANWSSFSACIRTSSYIQKTRSYSLRYALARVCANVLWHGGSDKVGACIFAEQFFHKTVAWRFQLDHRPFARQCFMHLISFSYSSSQVGLIFCSSLWNSKLSKRWVTTDLYFALLLFTFPRPSQIKYLAYIISHRQSRMVTYFTKTKLPSMWMKCKQKYGSTEKREQN